MHKGMSGRLATFSQRTISWLQLLLRVAATTLFSMAPVQADILDDLGLTPSDYTQMPPRLPTSPPGPSDFLIGLPLDPEHETEIADAMDPSLRSAFLESRGHFQEAEAALEP